MPLTREELSTYTDGSFLDMKFDDDVLLHHATGDKSQYISLSMYNQGDAHRDVILKIGNSEMNIRVQSTKRIQKVLPGLRLYNIGSGITISCAPVDKSAWSLPDNIQNTITVLNGSIAHVNTTSFSCTMDSVPLILYITDSRRSDTDIDPNKGTVGIVEINRVNGVITFIIIDSGRAFDHSHIDVSVKYGVLVFGSIICE
jgi:hypothetical protein